MKANYWCKNNSLNLINDFQLFLFVMFIQMYVGYNISMIRFVSMTTVMSGRVSGGENEFNCLQLVWQMQGDLLHDIWAINCWSGPRIPWNILPLISLSVFRSGKSAFIVSHQAFCWSWTRAWSPSRSLLLITGHGSSSSL